MFKYLSAKEKAEELGITTNGSDRVEYKFNDNEEDKRSLEKEEASNYK